MSRTCLGGLSPSLAPVGERKQPLPGLFLFLGSTLTGTCQAETSERFLNEFDPARRVILYCASGGRSALAADTLRQLGYSNVAHLDGGFPAWKEAGRPVQKVGS
ncbi:MAG: rhodanese-like domain-containing protein [Candidatus Methylomirabilales bacterium]|nr:hypothetical protein [candidate division NC10 bacterium]